MRSCLRYEFLAFAKPLMGNCLKIPRAEYCSAFVIPRALHLSGSFLGCLLFRLRATYSCATPQWSKGLLCSALLFRARGPKFIIGTYPSPFVALADPTQLVSPYFFPPSILSKGGRNPLSRETLVCVLVVDPLIHPMRLD